MQVGSPDIIGVDFLIDQGAVPIPVLNSALAALQQGFYAVGAYNTGKTQLRGAQRFHYTLNVEAIRYGSLHVDLVPAVILAIQQADLFTGVIENVAANVIVEAGKFMLRRLVDHFGGKPPESIINPNEPEQSPEVLRDQALWQCACDIAAPIVKSGIPIHVSMNTHDGTIIKVEANRNRAARVLQQDAIWRGRAQKYRNCQLVGVDISGPYLRAKIPYFQDTVMRCAFESLNPALVANSLLFGSEKYTIIGIPVWNPGRYHQAKPSKIEIITVEDSEGDIILTSVREDISEAIQFADGGLFSSLEEDVS